MVEGHLPRLIIWAIRDHFLLRYGSQTLGLCCSKQLGFPRICRSSYWKGRNSNRHWLYHVIINFRSRYHNPFLQHWRLLLIWNIDTVIGIDLKQYWSCWLILDLCSHRNLQLFYCGWLGSRPFLVLDDRCRMLIELEWSINDSWGLVRNSTLNHRIHLWTSFLYILLMEHPNLHC